ncbi:homoserine dehydrogenase [Acidobacterium sp. S8]|uniref:homoserine dehydrogenase n=1 Tax=Acidobacterium sp. S8 TaxID=1641854 RepID=UPI0020B16471|nr:homoserine dehydrogenase [Acidobacterium sp. S8]
MSDAQVNPLKLAILGFGTVGSSVARILCDAKPQGVELTHIFNRDIARKRVDWVPANVTWTENIHDVLSSPVDVVLELAGGLNPAGDWVRQALEAGKSVVTANKKLIAEHGIALDKLARSKGCHLFYGAAVAGGVPVIPGLQQGLAGDRITRIEGILNGTCNFILSKMEDGAEFAPILKEAQALGYAEADPTEDVAGFDARAKLVILSRIALRADLTTAEVPAKAITEIAAIDFAYASELGCTIRQISRSELRNGRVLATVGPMLVPKTSPLAWSRGTENMVLVGGAYGGDVVFSGHGAGGNPTAVAVISDLLAIAHGSRAIDMPSRKMDVSGDFLLRHYIRFIVKDRPGIIAQIAGALAEQEINIHAILQKPGHTKANLPFVVIVEPCASSVLKRALEKIAGLDCLLEPTLDLQILEPEPEV